MYKIIMIPILLLLINACSNHKVLKSQPSKNTLLSNQKFCYHLNQNLSKDKKIFNVKFLNKERQSSDFYIQYAPKILISNVIDIEKTCTSNKITIKNIDIFKKNLSDTAQWKEVYYVAVDISYQGKNYKLDDSRFKDYDTTGWVYVFWFHKPESEIVTETIQRALLRIFTDIEDTIENQLTLEQRNSKKSKDRLETEELMDKYIKLQKELE